MDLKWKELELGEYARAIANKSEEIYKDHGVSSDIRVAALELSMTAKKFLVAVLSNEIEAMKK